MMNILPYRHHTVGLGLSGLILTALFLLSSCKYLSSDTQDRSGLFEIHDIEFSEDLSEILVTCTVLKDYAESFDIDSVQSLVKVTSLNYRGIPEPPKAQPIVTKVDWTGSEKIKEADICMLAFVDLTRPESELTKARLMLKRYKKTFGDNLFLTFMLPEGKLSYTMPATEYAINMYVSHTALKSRMHDIEIIEGRSYLYSGLSELMERISSRQTHTYLDSTANITVAVFSSEIVYDEESNYPYDPNHFEIQDKLLGQLKDFPSGVSVYFLDGSSSSSETEDGGDADVEDDEWRYSIINVICSSTGGQYLKDFNMISFLRLILKQYDVYVPDHQIFLENRVGNVYLGKVKRLRVDICNQQDSVLATASKEYRVGDIYHPVTVGNISDISIWARGTALAILIFAVSYAILQFILPVVRYQLFRKRYVVQYKGPRQTHNGKPIPETCYFCKGTFVPGDKVVVKCGHVVHQECWDENGQHCPEYGISCEDGSHFYDKKHPYSLRNSPFYTQWVILSMLGAWVAWSMFLFLPGYTGYHIVDSIVNYLVEKIDSISMSSIDVLSARQYNLTMFAFNMAFYSTLVGSCLSVHRRKLSYFLLDVLSRSFVAGIVSFILFGIQCAGIVALKRYDSVVLLEILPWTLSVLLVEYASTYRTNARLNHRKYLVSAVILSLFIIIFMTPFASVDTVRQLVNLILVYMVFLVGVSFALAKPQRKKREAHLSASGSFKEMDVALYKWFLLNSNTIVTIGKSVDCSINLFMDLSGNVAPVHCSIKHVNDADILCISDNDVELNGRTAKYHKDYRLYYGDVFVIGGVKFRYHGI